MMNWGRRERSGRRRAFSACSVVLLCAVVVFGVLSVYQTGDGADCRSGVSFTAAPRTLRSATATRGAWGTDAITEINGTYVVTTPEHLAWIAQQVNSEGNNFSGKTISIEADIDLSGNDWVPIGGNGNFLVATVNGNGHTISNMTITSGSASGFSYAGLIGSIDSTSGSITNLHLRNARVETEESSSKCVGMLVGATAGGVTDCTVQGAVTVTVTDPDILSFSVGGVVGQVFTAALTNCHVLEGSTVKVKGAPVTGGVVGMLWHGSVTGCSFVGAEVSGAGTFTSGPIVGGIVGQVPAYSSVFTAVVGCTVSSDVKNTGGVKGSVGGILGRSAGYRLTIKGCLARGTVSGFGSAVGGILGYASTSTTIEDCTNEATVTNDLSNVAALSDAFSTMKQIGVGGIAGLIEPLSVSDTTYTLSISSVTNRGEVTMTGTPAGSDISGTASYFAGAGGIVGNVGDTNDSGNGSLRSRIEGSANEGTVTIDGSVEYTLGNNMTYAVAAGGIAGFYNANTQTDTSNSEGGSLDIATSYNAADVAANLAGVEDDLTIYAGGLVGATVQVQAKGDPSGGSYLHVSDSYNRGVITASGGEPLNSPSVGGLLGLASGVAIPNQAEIEYSYSIFTPASTVGTYGGLIGVAVLSGDSFAGSLDDNVYAATDTAFPAVGNVSDDTRGASSENDMQTGSAFNGSAGVVNWPTGRAWTLPQNSLPTLNYENVASDFVVVPGVISIDGGESATMGCVAMPHASIRSAEAVTYTAVTVPVEDQEEYFSSVTPTADGVTFTSNGKAGVAKVRITATVGNASFVRDALVFITSELPVDPVPETPSVSEPETPVDPEPETPDLSGTVSEFYVRNLPLTPEESTTRDIYITWRAGDDDADADPRSPDELPDPLPVVSWDITPPVGGGHWPVSVDMDATNPFRATLTIGSKTGSSSVTREQYRVTVQMMQEGGIDETYERGFYVGAPSPTHVVSSTQVQDLIDAANAVLCRTGVTILPGNNQPMIPQHVLDMIAVHLRDNLVTYSVVKLGALSADEDGEDDDAEDGDAEDGDAADDDFADLYVLTSLDQIDEMRVEQPDGASLPECFVSVDKSSANIHLDLTKLTDPDAEGKIVILPMTYSVKIESDDMSDFYGSDASAIVANPSANLDRIFEVLVLHKRIKEGAMLDWYTRLVDGVASPQEAYNLGMLLLEGDTTEGSLLVSLAYNVLNYHGESFVVQGNLESDGSGEDTGYIILPDGLQNDTLIDPLWTNRWASRSSGGVDGGGGGGGGCSTGAPFALALLLCAGVAASRSGRRSRGQRGR